MFIIIFDVQSLLKTCPPFTNPSDFFMDTLGLDVTDSENSKAEIHVNLTLVIYFN